MEVNYHGCRHRHVAGTRIWRPKHLQSSSAFELLRYADDPAPARSVGALSRCPPNILRRLDHASETAERAASSFLCDRPSLGTTRMLVFPKNLSRKRHPMCTCYNTWSLDMTTLRHCRFLSRGLHAYIPFAAGGIEHTCDGANIGPGAVEGRGSYYWHRPERASACAEYRGVGRWRQRMAWHHRRRRSRRCHSCSQGIARVVAASVSGFASRSSKEKVSQSFSSVLWRRRASSRA